MLSAGFTLMACGLVLFAVVREALRGLRHDDFHDVMPHEPFEDRAEEIMVTDPEMALKLGLYDEAPAMYYPEDWE